MIEVNYLIYFIPCGNKCINIVIAIKLMSMENNEFNDFLESLTLLVMSYH